MRLLVDIVAILAAPVAGLGGVFVGGLLQSRGEDARARRAEGLHREDRTFEHKRVAYGEFLDAYKRLADLHVGRKYQAPAPSSALDELRSRYVAVQMYGSVDAVHAGMDLIRVLNGWIYSIAESEPAWTREFAGIAQQYQSVLNAIRRDLGAAGNLHFS